MTRVNDQGMIVEADKMTLPKFTVKTRQIIVWGIILLALVGVMVGYNEGLIMAISGFLTLLKGDE